MPVPLVSVCMITYNHEPFIAQAIEGVLMQKTNFPVELVIGEDCSTDRTRRVCERYAQKNPDRIRLLPSDFNVGMHANGFRTWAAARGKYIAGCEGDDYWTDPLKLQMQVDCLERDPSLSLVYHNVKYQYEGADSKDILAFPSAGQVGGLPPPPAITRFRDILKGRMIPSLSVVYRATFLPEFPAWIAGLPVGDWPIFLLLLQRGPGLYLDRNMGVYRQHAQGVWSSQNSVQTTKGCLRTAFAIKQNIPMGAEDRRELYHGLWVQVLHCVEKLIRERRAGAALSVLHDYAWSFPAQALTNAYVYHLLAKAFGQAVMEGLRFWKSVGGGNTVNPR